MKVSFGVVVLNGDTASKRSYLLIFNRDVFINVFF